MSSSSAAGILSFKIDIKKPVDRMTTKCVLIGANSSKLDLLTFQLAHSQKHRQRDPLTKRSTCGTRRPTLQTFTVTLIRLIIMLVLSNTSESNRVRSFGTKRHDLAPASLCPIAYEFDRHIKDSIPQVIYVSTEDNSGD
jgi:hypothetical protein